MHITEKNVTILLLHVKYIKKVTVNPSKSTGLRLLIVSHTVAQWFAC